VVLLPWGDIELSIVIGERNMPIKFKRLTKEEIAKLPPKKTPAKRADRWDEILDAVAEGDVISIPVEPPDSLRGMRIGVARVATGERWRMKLEFRELDDGRTLVIMKSEEPFVSKIERSLRPSTTRRKRDEAER
jgi:hypothetical protein